MLSFFAVQKQQSVVAGSDMASTSAGPSTSATTTEEPRLDAGPLPVKRGELGYEEAIHGTSVTIPEPAVVSMPARHPADREATPTPTPTVPQAVTASDASSTTSMSKRRRLVAFLSQKKVASFGGIRAITLLILLLQLCLLVGTIVAWIFCVRAVSMKMPSGGMNGASSAIFIHVVFAVAVLGQLLFLERRIFFARAERYAFVHPGEILPSTRMRQVDQTVAFSPWNRPPLPTYAAALAQSGVGTGDVEDHMIAVIPPPAYGNTRGSRLLLLGYLNDSQRAQRPLSAATQMNHHGDRPVSYTSRDDDWEVIQDADRASELEATLARLDRSS